MPALQFYTGDYMKDPAVRSVSYAARGLWTDMLWLMHESIRRGYLQHVSGKAVTAEQLARMTGGSTDEVTKLLQELEDSGVFSRTADGTIYNRRMVRDEHKRRLCAEAGKKGGGNPTFKGQTKRSRKGTSKPPPKDSSYSYTDTNVSGGKDPPPDFAVEEAPESENQNSPRRPDSIWSWGWQVLTDLTETNARGLLGRKIKEFGEAEVIVALRETEKHRPAAASSYFSGILKPKEFKIPDRVV